MKKELLKSYINRLTKQDIVNYLSKECIPASDKEIDLIYNAIKNIACLPGGMGITSVEFPNTLVRIGNRAFSYNNLTQIKIPKGLTDVDYGAFFENKLQSIIFEGEPSNTRFGCRALEGKYHSPDVTKYTGPC